MLTNGVVPNSAVPKLWARPWFRWKAQTLGWQCWRYVHNFCLHLCCLRQHSYAEISTVEAHWLSSSPSWQLSAGGKGQAIEVSGAGFCQQQGAGYLTFVRVMYDASSSSCPPPGEMRFSIQTCNCYLEVKAVVCSGLVLQQPVLLL